MLQDNNKLAVAAMLTSSFSFALMQLFAKMAGDLPIDVKVFFRNLLGVVVLGFILHKKGLPYLGLAKNRRILLLRSVLGTLGVAANLYALDRMILADSVMLNRFSPFVVMILAAIFLKEKIGKNHIISLSVAFIGILLIIKPSFSLQMIPALIGFSSALFAGSAYVVVRYLKGREDPLTIVFFFSLFSCLVTAPSTIMGFSSPTSIQWLYLFGFGLFALGGQFFITLAYKYAPAGEISLYGYSTVIFSALLGYLVLHELPNFLSWLGIALIIGSAVYLYQTTKRIPVSLSLEERSLP